MVESQSRTAGVSGEKRKGEKEKEKGKEKEKEKEKGKRRKREFAYVSQAMWCLPWRC